MGPNNVSYTVNDDGTVNLPEGWGSNEEGED